MRRTTLALAALLISGSLAHAAAPASPQNAAIDGARQPGSIQPATPERLDPNVFRFGPIQAKDPATRTRIEQLYREQFDLRQNTLAQLKDLSARAQTETDSAARMELNKQGGQLKQDLQLRNMELGLEIARLNGDLQRVAEFEEALDHVRHPENYMPAYKPDPEVQARRLRELGITK